MEQEAAAARLQDELLKASAELANVESQVHAAESKAQSARSQAQKEYDQINQAVGASKGILAANSDESAQVRVVASNCHQRNSIAGHALLQHCVLPLCCAALVLPHACTCETSFSR